LIPPKNSQALASALRTLIVNREVRLRMGTAGREKAVREFSVDSVVATTLNTYSEAMAEARQPGGASDAGVGRPS